MSSFGRYCEVARDEREPIGKRYKSLRYAAERYSWLTRTSFRSIFDDLADRCALKVGSLNDSHALVAAALELERARRLFLEHLRMYTARRRVEKCKGQRSPTSGSIKGHLAAISLGRPLPNAGYARVGGELFAAARFRSASCGSRYPDKDSKQQQIALLAEIYDVEPPHIAALLARRS
jgi:hypothetical protein